MVKVSYTLLGAPISSAADEMVNVDGHWYGKHIVEMKADKAAANPPAADSAAKKD
jgi:hypothetical protein